MDLQRIIILPILLLASPARGQELDAAWFKASYLPAARKLEKAYGECSAEVSETVSNDKSGDYNEATYHFAYDGTRRKFDRTIVSYKADSTYERSRTIVASPEVSFSIFTRQGKEPSLQRVNRSPLGFAQATEQIDMAAFESIYAPFSVLGEPVSQYLANKDFEIKGVKREGEGIRVDFLLKKDNFSGSGWIVFLPDLQWVVDRWEVSYKITKPTELNYRMVSELSYGDDDPVPALTGWTTTTYDADRTDTDKLVVNKLTFAAAPASEFKLSSYGYDDRIGLPASVFRSVWFWLATIGTLCLVSGVVLRILQRRGFFERNPSSTAKTQ